MVVEQAPADEKAGNDETAHFPAKAFGIEIDGVIPLLSGEDESGRLLGESTRALDHVLGGRTAVE